MKVCILRKSLSDIKKQTIGKEYDTDAVSVCEFISEMVTRNYQAKPVADTLENCIGAALCDFADGCIYIVNATQNVKYADLDEQMNLQSGDELVLIKLKYVRWIIW